MSPKVEHSARGKKSLSRLVLEANTFAKTKPQDKPDTEHSTIECTPMKAIKQVPSLMDVTLSPIVNKSVLQSSTDSTMSESIDKDVKSDESDAAIELKPVPAFTTLHETCIEKSVLHSYQSSIVEISHTSTSIQEEKIVFKESSAVKPLPAFTLNETTFDKSVLHSYESSAAEASSIQEESTKPEQNVAKPFAAFVDMIQSDYEKSVLKSAQSSMAETSRADSKLQDGSSLITNDSDVDMSAKEDGQQTAAVIQKEKEKIVEIEREIHEIEGDMSEEEVESIGEEEIVEAEESEASEGDSESSGEVRISYVLCSIFFI